MGDDAAAKRTFKEKLMDTLAEAEMEAAASASSSVLADKQALAVEVLVDGCPDAFIDFFYLTTSGDGVADDNPTAAELETRFIEPERYEPKDEVPLESMQFLKDSLVAADGAARSGDVAAAGDAYKSLAKFFAGTENPKKAVFFFEKCLDLASAAGDAAAEMEANANLGAAHESMGNVAAAIAAFERQTQLAETSGDEGELRVGRGNLVRVYRVAAEQQRRRRTASGASGVSGASGDGDGDGLNGGDDGDDGVAFLEKCLEVAKLDGSNPAVEGLANHRLGLAHLARGDHAAAVAHQTEYLRLCAATGDRAGEGVARRSLAAVNQSQGDSDSAIANLEAFLDISKNGDSASQARTCCSLGKIYFAQRQFDRAVSYFERFFELARGLNDRRMLDVARVNLGVARGSARQAGFVKTVAWSQRGSAAGAADAGAAAGEEALMSLLLWKNIRVPLDTVVK